MIMSIEVRTVMRGAARRDSWQQPCLAYRVSSCVACRNASIEAPSLGRRPHPSPLQQLQQDDVSDQDRRRILDCVELPPVASFRIPRNFAIHTELSTTITRVLRH